MQQFLTGYIYICNLRKAKAIFIQCKKKNYQFHSTHSLGWICLHYKNGNAENNVLWFWLRYYKDKEGLICL